MRLSLLPVDRDAAASRVDGQADRAAAALNRNNSNHLHTLRNRNLPLAFA
jgi:hypothetical protein